MPSTDPKRPIEAKELRPATLRNADPLAIVVSGLVAIAGIFGLWTKLDLGPDEVAELGGTLLAIAAAIRYWLERRADAASSTALQAREGRLYRDALNRPQPKRVQRVGADGEGGALLVSVDGADDGIDPDDETPVRPIDLDEGA